jgi:anion-transporting  ArsA/GET3 family ATPase
VRLHVITGKGGTGKSTVAASLALALAARGATVLLCEAEGRQGIAQLFDVPQLPYEERRIVAGPQDGGDVYALAIDTEEALLEYLAMYYRLGRAGRALDRFGVVDFATTVAPGVRDVLLTGKVYEAVHRNRRSKNARQYDAVVLDAPPTGRIAQFLNVNNELAGLAKVGPIRNQADNVTTLLRSGLTRVHLVTVLEDMPVQETADGIAQLRSGHLQVGGVVVNLARPAELDEDERGRALAGRLDADSLRTDLERVGVATTTALVTDLLDEAREHAERRALEDEQRKRIAGLGVPTYELPRLADGIDLGGLYELAAELCRQGMA